MSVIRHQNNYLSEDEVKNFGFKSVGKDILISRKSCIYGAERMTLGDNIRIDDFAILTGNIQLGNHIHIAAMTYISGTEEHIIFEDFTGVSPFVYVSTSSADYSGRSLFSPVIPQEFRIEKIGPIIIRKFSVIGTHSFIMPNVELAEGTSVGAMSFMRKNSKPWTIYFGCPAQAIGIRERGIIDKSREFLHKYSNENVKVGRGGGMG
jgi:galactoside O-acetyltransferase